MKNRRLGETECEWIDERWIAEKKAEELFFKWLKEASKSEREGN